MKKTYTEFVCDEILNERIGNPIYSRKIAKKMAFEFCLGQKAAAAATAVALKRIMDGEILPDLRIYQKGIYYRTMTTAFGEMGINKEQLIADKYLLPDIGYETGPAILHRMGLTSQMPKERVLATNVAKNCIRADKKLDIMIRPPKVEITAKNKVYLQVLDVLDMTGCTPIDLEQPYSVLAKYIREQKLQYNVLLALADHYYNQNTVLQLAHTASAEGIEI